jgi:hypothetical protein
VTARRRLALGIVAACLALAADPRAYLELGADINGQVVGLKWAAQPVRYFVENVDTSGVTAVDLQRVAAGAFATWAAVPHATVSSDFAGFVDAPPVGSDGLSVIGFQPLIGAPFTLASTSFTIDEGTGALQEADIAVNTSFDWSLAPGGDLSHFDLGFALLHEIGHLYGLGHSGLGETELTTEGRRRVLAKQAVMFPIAFPPGAVSDRALDPDDEAGLADLYPETGERRVLGSVAGRVTRDGAGVFGAHVTAFNPTTGSIVGSFTLSDDGSFVISGLDAGLYVVRAEPLDDEDLASFFDDASAVDIDFRPAFARRLVAVPAGGSSARVEIRVTRK